MNDRILRLVASDNIRDHQIGGITDGITPEVAADIGFHEYTPDSVALAALKRVRADNADALGNGRDIAGPDYYSAYPHNRD